MRPIEEFRPSGKTSPLFFLFALLFAALTGGLSWVYQALLNWIPWIYVNFFIVIGFALAIFGAVFTATHLGKNRNAIMGAIAGLAIGVVGLGASHYFGYTGAVSDAVDEIYEMTSGAEDSMSRSELRTELEKEFTFSNYIDMRVEIGWSFSRSTSSSKGDLTGILVWLIWAIEALVMLGAGAVGGYMAAREPFCESCDVWMEEKTLFQRDDLDPAAVERVAAATNVEAVVQIPPTRTEHISKDELKYVGKQCEKCSGVAYLTVSKHWQVEKKNEMEDKDETLHSDILISGEDLQSLRQMSEHFPAV